MEFLYAVLTYVGVTTLLFGSPVHPIMLALLWHDRLGAPLWQLIPPLSLVALSFTVRFMGPVESPFRIPIFIILSILLPTAIVGVYADGIRHRAVQAFGADEVEEHSFFRSIREAPSDFQFFLHTAALKGCTPYAWSYRNMAFYVLKPDVGANVLPRKWLERCGIRIGNR